MACYIYKNNTYQSREDLESFLIEEHIQFQKELSDKGVSLTPNGFTINNEVYLNKDTMGLDTPVHEFAHLYNKALKQDNPELYQRGIDLVNQELAKETSEIQEVIDYVRQTQPNLQGEALAEEILTELTGRRGIDLLAKGQIEDSTIMSWIRQALEYIKNLLGLSQMSNEQAMNLTLQEYADAVAVDLLSGNTIYSNIKVKEGVEGLFNENENLVNSVYEALGFIEAKKTQFTKDEAQSIVEQWKANAVNLRGNKPSGSELNELNKAGNALFKKLISLKGEKYTKAPTKAELITDLFDRSKNKQVDLSEDSPVSALLNIATRFFNKRLYDVAITPQQKQLALQVYSQYLDTIFPDSQVKDIVYHGSDTVIDRFNKSYIGTAAGNLLGKGFYFAENKQKAKFYTEKVANKKLKSYNPSIINLKNPQEAGAYLENVNYNSYDGVKSITGQFVVFEPEQVHILGSKADIEGFKNYIASQNAQIEIESAYKRSESINYQIQEENVKSLDIADVRRITDSNRPLTDPNGVDLLIDNGYIVHGTNEIIDMFEVSEDKFSNYSRASIIRGFYMTDTNSKRFDYGDRIVAVKKDNYNLLDLDDTQKTYFASELQGLLKDIRSRNNIERLIEEVRNVRDYDSANAALEQHKETYGNDTSELSQMVEQLSKIVSSNNETLLDNFKTFFNSTHTIENEEYAYRILELLGYDGVKSGNQYVIRNVDKLNADIQRIRTAPVVNPEAFDSQSLDNLKTQLAAVEKITGEQADSLSTVINRVHTNIANRLGIPLEEYKRRTAVKTVQSINQTLSNFDRSLSMMSGLSSYIINNMEGISTSTAKMQDVFGSVKARFKKNFNLSENDYIMSSVLAIDERLYKSLGFDSKLIAGSPKKIKDVISQRIASLYDRAANSNEFYVQEFSKNFLKNSIKQATLQSHVDLYTEMLNGNQAVLTEQIKHVQSQQRNALLRSFNYLVNSTHYPVEFKYLMMMLTLQGNFAGVRESENEKGETIVIDGRTAQRSKTSTNNHQELSSMVLPSVYNELAAGSEEHPMALIEKYNDKTYISYAETQEIIESRIVKSQEDGYWVRFKQSEDAADIDALTKVSKKVAKVMNNNPWCTGGGMAESYLPAGDFYLFLDRDLEPKVTIRYEGDTIVELKGVDSGQALETNQADNVDSFLNDIPNGGNYKNQVALFRLKKKFDNNEPLTTSQDIIDYIATYTIGLETYDSELSELFDKQRKSRLSEIIDLNKRLKVYGSIVNSNRLGYTELEERTVILGTVDFSGVTLPEGFSFPEGITFSGDVDFRSTTFPKGFSFPEGTTFNGDVIFTRAKFPKGFSFSEGTAFKRYADFSGARFPKRFSFPEGITFNGGVHFINTKFPEGFSFPEGITFSGDVIFSRAKFPEGFSFPEGTTFNGDVDFRSTKFPEGFSFSEGTTFKGRADFSEANLPESVTIPGDLALRQDARGAYIEGANDTTLILLDRNNADVTTPIHEIAHEYEKVLTVEEIETLENWSGHRFGTVEFSEAFAKGAELYIYEGSTHNGQLDGIFERFARWFREVIENFIEYFGNTRLNDDVRDIYAKMLIDKPNSNIVIRDSVETSVTPASSTGSTYSPKKTDLPEDIYYLTKTDSFKHWFKNSVVKTDKNEPMVVWTWTESNSAGSLIPKGLGTHFGSMEFADSVKGSSQQGFYRPAFLSISNPLEVVDMGRGGLGTYYYAILEALEDQGVIVNPEDMSFFNTSTENGGGEYSERLSNLIESHGFDSFYYTNEHGDTIYVAVKPEQIKSLPQSSFNPYVTAHKQVSNTVTAEEISKCL